MEGSAENRSTDRTNVAIQADQPTEMPKAPQDQHDRSDTITITISRDVAKDLAEHDLKDWKVISPELTEACRAALEGER